MTAPRSQFWTWRAALAGLIVTLAWGAVVVLLDQGGRARGGTRLHRPPAGALVRASPDRAIEVSGTARGRDGCSLASLDQGLLIEDGSFAGRLQPPGLTGERLLWLRVACDGEERDRFARRLQIWPVEGASESLVARVFVHAEVIQNLLREQLAPALNAAIRSWIATDTPIRLGRGWFNPLRHFRISSEARITVTNAYVQFSGREVYIRLTLEVDMPIDGPVPVAIRGSLVRVSGTAHVVDAQRIEIRDLDLEGSLCDDFNNPIASRACGAAQILVEPRIEALLGEQTNLEVNRWIRDFDLSRYVRASLVDWARRAQLGERLAAGIDVSGLSLRNARGGVAGVADFEAEFVVDSEWLGRPVPSFLPLEDTEQPFDLAISAALVNRLLELAFDRPMSEVMEGLQDFATSAGFGPRVKAMRDWLDSIERGTEPTISEFLELADLRVDQEEGRFVPGIDPSGEGELTLFAAHSTLLAGVEDPSTLALSVEARLRFDPGDDSVRFSLDPDHTLTHFALEPTASSEEPLTAKQHQRRALLAGFLLRQLDPATGLPGERAIIDRSALRDFLSVGAEISTELEFDRLRIGFGYLRSNRASQSLALGGSLTAEPE